MKKFAETLIYSLLPRSWAYCGRDLGPEEKCTCRNAESARQAKNTESATSGWQENTYKTGYTKKTGRCLVSSADKNGHKLICVVLNCGPMFEESDCLLNMSYENYKNVELLSSYKGLVLIFELK